MKKVSFSPSLICLVLILICFSIWICLQCNSAAKKTAKNAEKLLVVSQTSTNAGCSQAGQCLDFVARMIGMGSKRAWLFNKQKRRDKIYPPDRYSQGDIGHFSIFNLVTSRLRASDSN
jgi:hypothetical protein